MDNGIGLYNENFQMNSQEILEEKTEEVAGRASDFKIMAGPMKLSGDVYKNTYVLEIHYKDSKDDHAKTLPLNGFNSQLCLDYAEKANRLAEDFCEENGFVINNYLNLWPEFQAIVSKLEKKV
jgi:hypothetical protein